MNSGKPWTKEMMHKAVASGPHMSALEYDVIEQLKEEIAQKVKNGQCTVVESDKIKDSPPEQLKISPLAMIPHKSRKYRAILDLSFCLRLKNGGHALSVNENTTLEAPAAAIDQMGHALSCIIHAFAQAEEDDNIFVAKIDIKDGFWRLDCAEGEEWSFAYVLPQHKGEPTRLVVPTSLQMGWVKSPPYFCAASETACDVATQYVEAPVGSLEQHKFLDHAMGGQDVTTLPASAVEGAAPLISIWSRYMWTISSPWPLPRLKSSWSTWQMQLCTEYMMCSLQMRQTLTIPSPSRSCSRRRGNGHWALKKDCLGFTFDGAAKTMQLEEPKKEFLLATFTKWIRTAKHKSAGIAFPEFESIIAKVRHAFMCIPEGRGLLTPMNKLLRKRPPMVFLQQNKRLLTALKDCRTILREATRNPTKCSELVMGEPDYVGVKDASVHGVGGIIIGDNKKCVPTVFRMEWPQWVKDEVEKTNSGRGGSLMNLDLEMAGLLLLFLVMEDVCQLQPGDHLALFSDNSPTVSWVRKMAAKGSKVADQ